MRRLSLFLCLPLVAGCGKAEIPPVTPALEAAARAHWSDATSGQLSHGRALFTTRCTACHSQPDPANHSAREWNLYVDTMAEKAQLDTEQQRDLRRYVLAAHGIVAGEQP